MSISNVSQGDESRPSSRSSSPVKTRRYASALSRSESMNNVANDEEDEKDKKIRELEETLRKQKELMEILQKKLCDDGPPNQVVKIENLFSFMLRENLAICCLGQNTNTRTNLKYKLETGILQILQIFRIWKIENAKIPSCVRLPSIVKYIFQENYLLNAKCTHFPIKKLHLVGMIGNCRGSQLAPKLQVEHKLLQFN